MRSVTVIIPVAFIVRAQTEELTVTNTSDVEDSMDKLVDKLVDNIFNRIHTIAPHLNADFDGTTLVKPGHPAMAPHMSAQVAYRPEATRSNHVRPVHNPSVGVQQARFGTRQTISGLSAPMHYVSSSRSSVKVQANLFDRFSRAVKSNLNSLLQSAEDPEKVIDQAVNEMQDDLVKLKQEVAKYMGTLKQAEAKYNTQADESAQWLKRAELALSKDDEELAREALKRKQTADELAQQYKVQLDNTKSAVDQLVANVRLIEQKVQEAQAKKQTLKARAATARSSKQIQELVTGMDTGKSALGAFDAMEQKVMSLEAESESVAQLAAPEKSVMDKFKELEAGSSVDDELKSMKAKMLGSGKKESESKGAVPETGKPVRDVIDAELEELRKKSKGP